MAAAAAPTTPATDAVPEQVAAIDEHGRRVQAMFSDIAPGYDRANRLMSLGIDVSWRRRAVEDLLPDDAEGPRILDLCAGTLDSTRAIARRHASASLVAGDFSAGMLEQGQRRLSADEAARIRVAPMDAHAIPEPDASFDAVLVAFGLRNVSDPERATREIARVLRPGGRATILDFFRPVAPATRLFHRLYNRTVLPLAGWACTGNLDAYRYLPRSMGGFFSADEYAALAADAGLVRPVVTHLTLGVATIVRLEKGARAP